MPVDREADLVYRAMAPSRTLADIDALGHAVALRLVRPSEESQLADHVYAVAGGKQQMLQWLVDIDGLPAVVALCFVVNEWALDAVQSRNFMDAVNATRRAWSPRVVSRLDPSRPVSSDDLAQLAVETTIWLFTEDIPKAVGTALVLIDIMCAEIEPPRRGLRRVFGTDPSNLVGPLSESSRPTARRWAARLQRECPSAVAELAAAH